MGDMGRGLGKDKQQRKNEGGSFIIPKQKEDKYITFLTYQLY